MKNKKVKVLTVVRIFLCYNIFRRNNYEKGKNRCKKSSNNRT